MKTDNGLVCDICGRPIEISFYAMKFGAALNSIGNILNGHIDTKTRNQLDKIYKDVKDGSDEVWQSIDDKYCVGVSTTAHICPHCYKNKVINLATLRENIVSTRKYRNAKDPT